MDNYKPDDKVLKQVADSLPKELTRQIKLSDISFASCPDYRMFIDYSNFQLSPVHPLIISRSK